MVRCWYFNESATDEPRIGPHYPSPQSFLSLEEVKTKTGLEYLQFPTESIDTNPEYIHFKTDRDYKYEDEIIISPKALPDFAEKIEMFFTEHIHADDEIRFVVSGGGFFDLREVDENRWIRVETNPGDLLVLPAGIYHRFTLDHRNIIHLKRIFADEPCWKSIKKPESESHPIRHEYLKRIQAMN